MTIPNKLVAQKATQTEVTPQETQEVEVTSQETQEASKKVMKVDIGAGIRIELPEEEAQKYIKYQSERTKGYKDLESKLNEINKVAQKESERAKLLELAKDQNVEAIKEEVTKDLKNKLQNLQSKVIDKEIENVFKSREDFIKDYAQDALKLFKSEYVVTLDEQENPIANGKKLEEAAKEFLEKKEIFRKATSKGTQNGPIVPIRSVNKVPQANKKVNLSNAVGSAFKIK